MQIDMVTEAGATRHWQIGLAERLRRDGHVVHVSSVETARQALPQLGLLEIFETLVYRIPAADRLLRERVAAPLDAGSGDADLIIDLSAEPSLDAGDVPRLVPTFGGACGEAAALAALLEGSSPALGVVLVGKGDRAQVLAMGPAALQSRHCLTSSLAEVCRRTGDVLDGAIRRLAAGEKLDVAKERVEIGHVGALAPARFAAASLAAQIGKRLASLVRQPDHWRVGWRRSENDSIAATLTWPQREFTFVRDDAARYYADPFVFVEDGVAHVFCEEYPYATRKALISVFTIGPDGAVGTPRPVLEADSHLSYPMVFRHRGTIWMIPESSDAGRIELYRAERFPDRWTRAAVLVENVAASDATLVAYGGLLWLFAAVAEAGASSWDALGLYHAGALEGPWSAHPANPVVVDAGAARPAGRMFEHEGALIRPAQDCRKGYGAALAFCAVERLDPEGFAQRLVRRFEPPAAWRAQGLHTYNAATGFEVVDCLGTRRRI